jgi:hypothetical protein
MRLLGGIVAIILVNIAYVNVGAQDQVIQRVVISPRYASANGAINIEVSVENVLDISLTNLTAVPAVAGDVRFEVLRPSQVVQVLVPGAKTTFRMSVSVHGTGIPRVGAGLSSDQGIFAPVGQTIFIRGESVGTGAVAGLSVWLGLLVFTANQLIRWLGKGDKPRNHLVTGTATLTILGLSVLWLERLRYSGYLGDVLVILILVALWITAWRGFAHQKSWWPVVAVSVALFLVAGLAWSAFEQIGIWQRPVTVSTIVDGAQAALTWPLGLSQLLWFVMNGSL